MTDETKKPAGETPPPRCDGLRFCATLPSGEKATRMELPACENTPNLICEIGAKHLPLTLRDIPLCAHCATGARANGWLVKVTRDLTPFIPSPVTVRTMREFAFVLRLCGHNHAAAAAVFSVAKQSKARDEWTADGRKRAETWAAVAMSQMPNGFCQAVAAADDAVNLEAGDKGGNNG